MTEDERALRRRLRAHGRQLGDRRDRRTGGQGIDRLAHEMAYEHWHRMLFARFLAENRLLIEPESQVPVSLAECEELAQERGADTWSLAGAFAARMLPRIFRPDEPALKVALAPETRQALRGLLDDLPAEVFKADDALGWTYQFWQAEHKDEVNASGVKIGADQLPPVTQLFTERYMVRFLFHIFLSRPSIHNGNIRGQPAWNRGGVVVSETGRIIASIYTGERFLSGGHVISPHDEADTAAIWCFCKSGLLEKIIRENIQKPAISSGYFNKVPFDLPRWQKVAAEQYPKGLPEPYSDDPTQWIFHGHPCGNVVWDPQAKWTTTGQLRKDASVLQVAVARLLGYRWPAEQDADMRLAAEQRAWVERCAALHEHSDEDGIVCLPALRGEASAADRLRKLLGAAYGNEWSAAVERALLAACAEGKQPAASLEDWLRDRFFAEHCALFNHRPFVWHVWDGRRDGFHALVNYHQLAAPNGAGRRALEALAYSYLGDWIIRQQAQQEEEVEGADGRLAAARNLQDQLKRILDGEPPCDLFVRWKPLHDQPMGWEPDLDDGVRLNIRPFLSAELRFGGRKGAGILRGKPTVKWTKDRGKEPQALRPRDQFPWFWSCPGNGDVAQRTDYQAADDAPYDGNRWNDLHYANATKAAARAAAVKRDHQEA